ncbi:unnamed protein product [Miscanthus lutarioriparius]|uniref:RING-type domain-containing protein n=1 Tax=Miscanthus lutarioriparius TaxID=422564 RepID=A0A811PSI6_9POAL|nr:unnamed protein product [Miscanthus lutarioriparius]
MVSFISMDVRIYQKKLMVTNALAHAGLESSNLIVGIDFTKSNEWTGPTSFAPIIETAIGIVDSSGGYDYPLSIVLVGVGDGPWDMMRQFDDNIPSRAFDNFQFVNFTQIMSRPIPASKKEAEFALSALMEIPEQFKAALSLQLLGYFLVHLSKPSSYLEIRIIPCLSLFITTCPICWSQTKNLAFGCGHQTCSDCSKDLKVCPICQRAISTRLKLY